LVFFKFNDFNKCKSLIGPTFLKKGFSIIAFNKARGNGLSKFIAIYFLSTIVADQIASAINLLSTKA